MESIRVLQQNALRQLFRQARLRQSPQIQHPTPQRLCQTRPPILPASRRTLHTVRLQASYFRPRMTKPTRPQCRFQSQTSSPMPANDANLTMSQRFKRLSKEYGWSAVGVYLFLSVLDFPFCFLAVRMLGTDRIGRWEHIIVSTVMEWVRWPMEQTMRHGATEEASEAIGPIENVNVVKEGGQRILEEDQSYLVTDHGVKEAEKNNKGEEASIWTQLVLAYAIHKSFIFVRIPLTVAVTPPIVRQLRRWGWNIGNMTAKGVAASARNAVSKKGKPGVNTQKSGINSGD